MRTAHFKVSAVAVLKLKHFDSVIPFVSHRSLSYFFYNQSSWFIEQNGIGATVISIEISLSL